jgi:uncharacterized membrane protein YgcG
MPMRTLLSLFLTIICATAEERILSFGSEIRVGRDGFLDVVETIRVNVERNQISRGIYRDFPQDYVTKWGLRQRRPFEVKGVMRNGVPEPFAVEPLGSGTRVRIGSADVFLDTGSVQEYRITYRTGRQLWFDEKGDELYWNVTGNFWDFPIVESKARVILPEGIEVLEAEAYTGLAGAKGRDYVKTEETDGVSFRATKPLSQREGLTIVVRWEPGKLNALAYKKPGVWAGNEVLLLGLVIVAVGLLVFVALWVEVGRDPARGVIVPGWEPPAGFSPAAVRYLKNMGFDDRCFTAAVLSLASKGFLRIEEYGVSTYKLIKEKGKGDLSPNEDGLFEDLFSNGKSLLLDQVNHAQIYLAKTNLAAALHKCVRGKYFNNHTGKWFIGLVVCLLGLGLVIISAEVPLVLVMMMFVFMTVGTLVISALVAGIIAGRTTKVWGGLGVVLMIGLAGVALVLLGNVSGVWCALTALVVIIASPVFYFLMKAPTRAGRKALDTIAGFREYLSVAEEDRLNLENPPERTPQLFERFLPYALALGVEQNWSEKFDDVLTAAGKEQGGRSYTPTFYTGGHSGLENALTGAAIGTAIGGALAASSVAPSSSGSSGGGGFSSGGSSGGGGGGGGGGGW